MNVAPDILAAQRAYAARPFAVHWQDSHFSGSSRFHTFDEAFEYMHHMVALTVREVARYTCRESFFRRSYIETPAGRMPVRFYILAGDVSSYGGVSS